MTNTGLCSLSELVTGGLLEFEKTKWKMKKIIKENLSSYLDCVDCDLQMRKDQMSSLLNNPEHFFGNYDGFSSPSTSFRADAISMLDMLEQLPRQALVAMHRKLRGKRESILKLESGKIRKKCQLVPAVRTRCMKMLSKLDEGKEPPELLVEAMSIAGLTVKLILGYSCMTEFKRFSPEVEALQNNIAMAVWHISTAKKVSSKDLEEFCKKLRLLTDPKAEFPRRSLRNAVKSVLIEYLFECSHMESIPEHMVEMLNKINKSSLPSSSRSISKKEAEEEVESLLSLSAQIKQIIWDILPDEEIEQDFSTAYMEDLEDDDEEDYRNELHASQNLNSYEPYRLAESIGETKPLAATCKAEDSAFLSPNGGWNLKDEPLNINEGDSFCSSGTVSFSCLESRACTTKQTSSCDRQLLASLEELHEAKTNVSGLTVYRDGSSSNYDHENGDESDIKREESLRGHVGDESIRSCSKHEEPGNDHQKQCRNHYLAIQWSCDKTAMAISGLIDGMLNEFAEAQCLD